MREGLAVPDGGVLIERLAEDHGPAVGGVLLPDFFDLLLVSLALSPQETRADEIGGHEQAKNQCDRAAPFENLPFIVGAYGCSLRSGISAKSDGLSVHSEAPCAIAQAAMARSISRPRARGSRA